MLYFMYDVYIGMNLYDFLVGRFQASLVALACTQTVNFPADTATTAGKSTTAAATVNDAAIIGSVIGSITFCLILLYCSLPSIMRRYGPSSGGGLGSRSEDTAGGGGGVIDKAKRLSRKVYFACQYTL